MSKETVAVIGLGYVGLPVALLAEKKGYRVIGIDIDETKVELLDKRISPFVDTTISSLLASSNLEATGDFSRVQEANIIIICVPTPVYENHMPNFELIVAACKAITPFLYKDQLIILESTVNPGVTEEIVRPIFEEGTGLKAGKDFFLAHCPERINPGDTKWNIENIPRVVGSIEKVGLERCAAFYESLLQASVKPMNSIREAEAVKVVENSFRDINIALVNELAMSFSRMDIDVVSVIEGAATKPFSFMPHYPGCGVGGHCIPVDPYYLIEYGKKNGFHHDFLSLARRINTQMPKFTVDRLAEGLNEKKISLNGTRVALLGLSYKPEIGDYRESPSFAIVKYLQEYGADVAMYDPFVEEHSNVQSLQEACERAKGVIVATAHNMFRDISPPFLKAAGVEVLVDGRNCLAKSEFKEAGILYKGIGR